MFCVRHTEAVLEVADGLFHTCFIIGIPFRCTTDCVRISAEVLFQIDVDHSSAGRCCAWCIIVVDRRLDISDLLYSRIILGQMNFTVRILQRRWNFFKGIYAFSKGVSQRNLLTRGLRS